MNRGYDGAPAPSGNPLEPAVATAELQTPDLDDLCPLCGDWIVDGECGCPV